MKIIKKKEIWAFDFDDTLIKTNHVLDSESLYYQINEVKFNENMMDLLLNLLKEGKEVFIITARPIEVRQKIAEICKVSIDHIYCRDFSNTRKEILKIMKNERSMRKFTKNNVKFKIRVLKELASKCEILHFYDDLAEKYKKKKIKGSILIELPIP